MKKPAPVESASALIDQRIEDLADWRGKILARVRKIIHAADRSFLNEERPNA